MSVTSFKLEKHRFGVSVKLGGRPDLKFFVYRQFKKEALAVAERTNGHPRLSPVVTPDCSPDGIGHISPRAKRRRCTGAIHLYLPILARSCRAGRYVRLAGCPQALISVRWKKRPKKKP